MLLLRPAGGGLWEALTRPARKARPGTSVDFGSARAIVVERRPDGMHVVRFEPANVAALLEEQGELALPPYIREVCRDPERYQTVYARQQGAVAAPTAGLHFTPRLLDELRAAGVETATVTLHAGLGTFRPVKAEKVEDHAMHAEEFELTDSAAEQVNRALTNGRRVVCAGTTTVRVLEGQSGEDGHVQPGRGQTSLYIYPGYRWKVAGAVLTNFHLPKSTLLMLVSAFAGREKVLRAYKHAITEKYRFYSFGDALFII
jgi:S-adenosylmethionine:tRNA ribosyltransferase-isomerase